jgi:mono/diheme cytochrome c family protein
MAWVRPRITPKTRTSTGVCATALTVLLACAKGTTPVTPSPVGESPAPSQASPLADPYHPVPRDTLDEETYEGWKRYSLFCARCHGDEATGTTFGPNLVKALGPEGTVKDRDDFMKLMQEGRTDKGMPTAAKAGLDPEYYEGVYQYLSGRSAGRYHGGRPARR